MNAHLPERQSRPAYLPNPGARLKRLHVHYGSKTPGMPQPTPQHPFRFLTVTRIPATHLSRVHGSCLHRLKRGDRRTRKTGLRLATVHQRDSVAADMKLRVPNQKL
jgi:hypothetical protein